MLLSLLAYCIGKLRVKRCTYIIWTEQRSIHFLSEKFEAEFSEIFKFLNFQVLCKGNYLKHSDHTNVQFSRKKCFFFANMRKCITLQTAHRNFLILCQTVLHPNITFLISKQNKRPKIYPKILKQ